MKRLLALSLLLGACGPAAPRVAEPEIDRLAPTTLYPMLEGAQWVYDVDTGAGPPVFGAFTVTDVSGDTRTIANNRGMDAEGNVRYAEPTTYEIGPEGIRHVATGMYLLRVPIEAGAEWETLGGRTARVTDLDHSVEVPAGSYDHCVEVTETGGEDGRTVRTVYCPGVGPVEQISRMDTQLTMQSVSTHSRLRSYSEGDDEF